MSNCYVCGKLLRSYGHPVFYEAFLQDDDHRAVEVGKDCLRRVIKSGYDGLPSGNGHGPLVFAERRWAEAYGRR